MTTIRHAACTILLREAVGVPYEVYLARRSKDLEFLGGFDVFPGGTTDAIDAEIPVRGATEDPARCATAVRELFEETGVLAVDGAAGVDATTRNAARRALVDRSNGNGAWVSLLEQNDLHLDAAKLMPMGTWVTPSYVPWIYHANYYAVWLPKGEQPEIWAGELTDGNWYSPQKAIAAHQSGELFISYPVLETLKTLIAHGADLEAASREMCSRDDTGSRIGGEMLNGIHVCAVRTPTLPPATHTNCFIIGGREMVIVDPATPYEDEQDRLLAYVRGLQRDGRVIREIWLSHQHQDHIGGVERMRDELHVGVAAHRLTAEGLRGDIDVDRLIEDGEIATFATDHGVDARWRALHTPGHARGHLCFYEENSGTLLSGDNILGFGTVLISPPEGNMRTYMETLVRLRELRLGFILPSHGPPVAAATEKIEFYLAHRKEREEQIYATLAGGELTPREIVPQVYDDVDPTAYPLAEINVRAHLEKMVAEGFVRAGSAGRFGRLKPHAKRGNI